MKKLIAFFRRIPRPVLTGLCVVGSLLCLLVIYIVIGAPSFSPEMQFRRLEHSYMIGPGDILGTESANGKEFLLVAKTDTQLMLYYYEKDTKTTSQDLLVREKNGTLTLMAGSGRLPIYTERSDFDLPMILFDDHPNAVRAEVEFTMFLGDYEDPAQTIPYKKTFFMEASRKNPGYFYFTIHHKAYTSPSYAKMFMAMAYMTYGYNYNEELVASTPITVRLYDRNDQLIVDEIIYFRTNVANGEHP